MQDLSQVTRVGTQISVVCTCFLAFAGQQGSLKAQSIGGCSSDGISQTNIYGAVSGVVKNAQDSAIISGAAVRVKAFLTTANVRSGTTFSVSSAVDGQFRFDCLPEGAYSLEVSASDFAESHSSLSIRANSQTEISVELNPEASISGAVVDADGRGIPNVVVRAFGKTVVQGKITFRLAGSATSGMSGSYAIRGLLPGGYIVQATRGADPPVGADTGKKVKASNARSRPSWSWCTYYPASTLISASLVSVAPGQLAQAGITYLQGPAHTIRGRVVAPGKSSWDNVTVRLIPCRDDACIEAIAQSSAVGGDGAFSFPRITGGTYRLQILGGPEQASQVLASTNVYVYSSDVDNLTLTPTLVPSVRGRMELAENRPDGPWQNWSEVVLVPDDPPGPTQTSTVGADGGFDFPALNPGSYSVHVTAPPGYFVDAIAFDNQNISERTIDVQSGEHQLDIEVKSGAGSIIGSVRTHEDGQQADLRGNDDAVVVLYPENGGRLITNAPIVTRTANERVYVPDLAPGSYLLFALQHFAPDLWEFDDFVRLMSSQGTEVDVGEDSQVKADLTLIPDADIASSAAQLGLVLRFQ